MIQWEYDVTEGPHKLEELMEIMDKRGKQGWELVTVIEKIVGGNNYIAIMKRKLNT
jgi:hypothetical protein